MEMDSVRVEVREERVWPAGHACKVPMYFVCKKRLPFGIDTELETQMWFVRFRDTATNLQLGKLLYWRCITCTPCAPSAQNM